MKPPRHSPRDLAIYRARALIREARARRGTPFAATLLLWAANARREAARGTERDLFGKKDEAR